MGSYPVNIDYDGNTSSIVPSKTLRYPVMVFSQMRRYSVHELRLAIHVAANGIDEIEERVSGADFQRRLEHDVIFRDAQLHPSLEQRRRVRPRL